MIDSQSDVLSDSSLYFHLTISMRASCGYRTAAAAEAKAFSYKVGRGLGLIPREAFLFSPNPFPFEEFDFYLLFSGLFVQLRRTPSLRSCVRELRA